MSYEKQNFKNGPVLTAEHLNNMEQGIEEAAVQTDWNQTDDTAPDFLKNKPFGDELVEIIPETEVVSEDLDGMFGTMLNPALFTGNESQLVIAFDGTEYVCDAIDSGEGYPIFGNMSLIGGDDTGEPFVVVVAPMYDLVMVGIPDLEPHLMSIFAIVAKKIDDKYVPSQTVLYINSANKNDVKYLYMDAACTIVATKADLVTDRAVSIKIGSLVAITPLTISLTYSFGLVVLYNDGDYLTYYTAEYEPTT